MRDGYKAIKNTHRKWKVKHDMRKSIKYNIIMGLFESPLVVNAVISHACFFLKLVELLCIVSMYHNKEELMS